MLYIHLTCHVVKVMLGGSGLYGSTKDYLTFLRHLLLVKGKYVAQISISHLTNRVKKLVEQRIPS